MASFVWPPSLGGANGVSSLNTLTGDITLAAGTGITITPSGNTLTIAATSGNAITALTGDGTATGPGSVALTLATVNSNVGSFGTATGVGTFTVNGKGLVTAASTTAIQITESQVTNLVSDLAGKQASGNYITALTGDATAAGPGSVAITLATVNSNVGSFTNASITVNGKGLVTAASSGTAPVTSVSVATANGLAGSSSGGATPALTLSTTITGILQGNGTAISAATATGSGSVVLATSPILVTPALGTPTALVGTNITGTASGLTAGTVTTNANLTGDVTSSGNATTYSGTVPLNKGGTGQTTKAPAFDALQPMTTGGDLIYGGASGTGTRLANGSAGQVLTSGGTTVAPSWTTIGTIGATTLDGTYVPLASPWGTCTNISVWYKIVGDEMHCRGTWKTGTDGASTAAIQLPASKLIDTTKMTATANVQQVGFASAMQNTNRATFSATNANFVLFYDGSTNDRVFLCAGASARQFDKFNAGTNFSNNDVLTFDFWVPIQ